MRYPSLLPALSLAAGIGAAAGVGTGWLLLAFATAAAILSRRPRRGRLILLAACFWWGGFLLQLAADLDYVEACRRLPAPGVTVTGEFSGTLARSAEPLPAGERRLVVELDTLAGSPRVALTVGASPPAPTLELDRRRAGDKVRVWATLRRPRAMGNPGERPPELTFRARGWHAVGRVKSARLVVMERAGGGWRRRVDDVRAATRRSLDAIAGRQPAVRGLLGAMLLGEGGLLDQAVRARLQAVGAAHLLAISGLHAGAIAAGLALIAVRLRARGPGRSALMLLALALFAHFVGERPAVSRAVVVAWWFAAGRELGRKGRPLHTLGVVATLLLACRPFWLLDAGFLLSFAAAAGLVLAAPGGRRGLPVRLSAGAYATTAPLSAVLFGHVAPAGILANVLAAPAGVLIVILGYVALAVQGVPLLGPLAGWTLSRLGGLLLEAAVVAGALGARVLPLTASSDALAIAAVTATLLGLAWRRTVPVVLAALLQLAVHIGPPPPPPTAAFVDVISVGQGQAVLVRDAQAALLVDAGGSRSPGFDPGERIVAPFVRRVHGPRLDVFALSHGDLDHAGGARGVLENLEVAELWVGPGWWHDPLQRRTVATAGERGVAVVLVRRGDRRQLGDSFVSVAGPAPAQWRQAGNERSLVLIWGTAPNRVLLPGDLERQGETELLRGPAELSAELLVVPHHGSKGALSSELLARVGPRHAAVSCGFGNRFGHPAMEVVARLRDAGVTTLRTDLDGWLRYVAGPAGWRYQENEIGIGVKVTTNSSASNRATSRRPRPSGCHSSSSGGWRSRM